MKLNNDMFVYVQYGIYVYMFIPMADWHILCIWHFGWSGGIKAIVRRANI